MRSTFRQDTREVTLLARHIPLSAVKKATAVLGQWLAHKTFAREIHGSGNLSLKVTYHWRLLSRDNGESWELMSHEKYNRLKDR